ncbi:MAG TPA: TPM domain-containing protein [Pseudomonadales bacterium]|nr:TPM domain-containing protein [Pseudomonadales bacterium]
MRYTEQDRNRIAEAVGEVEKRTNAELVTVLAAHSGDYGHHAIAVAAIAALLLSALLVLLQPNIFVLLTVQLGLFCALIALFRIPAIARRIIPQHLGHWHASNMARRQFLEHGLHHTANETGVLIFVSEAERYVEILADRGVSAHVDDTRWQAIVDRFVDNVKRNRVVAGFVDAIAECGDVLAEAVPKSADNPNELPNRLILIGYD